VLDEVFAPGARFAPVLVRVIVGVVGAVHGWPKMKDLGAFIANVEKLGIPLAPVFGTAAALSEFLGGIALILGLFGRWAGFFFACTMAVAVFKVHGANGFLSKGNGYEYPLVLLVASISIVLSGSGPLSIDRLLGKKK
jgi:putative oxidoreductase